jgi:hypothetical protein
VSARILPAPAPGGAPFSEAMALGMSEATLQANILHEATCLGWLGYHTYDSRRSVRGFPDLVLVHGVQQRLIFTELKKQTGRQSPAQIDWDKQLRAASRCEFYLWRPSDWLSGSVLRILQGQRPTARAPR